MKGRFIKFLKDWMLVIGMISGASAYLIYAQIPSIHTAGPVLEAPHSAHTAFPYAVHQFQPHRAPSAQIQTLAYTQPGITGLRLPDSLLHGNMGHAQ